MAGVKGRSGGWNKRKEVDYSMLQRYSLAYLLRIMRSKNEKYENKKFKTALELSSKFVTKPITLDNSKHTHVTYAWKNHRNRLQPSELPGDDTQ